MTGYSLGVNGENQTKSKENSWVHHGEDVVCRDEDVVHHDEDIRHGEDVHHGEVAVRRGQEEAD